MDNARTFVRPAHLVAVKWLDRPVDYEWDEDDILQYFDRESTTRLAAVESISVRGQLALAAATTEWVLWRLDGQAEFPDVRDFVEAVWAAVVDFNYIVEWTRPRDRELTGPVLHPLLTAARLLDDVYVTTKRARGTDDEVIHISFFAEHISRGRKAYKDWLKAAFGRATRLSPLSEESMQYLCTSYPTPEQRAAFDFGAPVPRTAFDMRQAYDPVNLASDLDAYLQGLDWERNRFLKSPDAMRSDGFTGEPYRYATD